ncbi:MAG: bifunctional DNA-formamidopyrimidine glycosylase/DNA-(apurinic or apyrimidinic site) lyase [Patescibacteria group bacterium]|nr:bifunctional DNA-formamidopyrimidine glycosylase/DNA-(apurinic or apyrimidinic site) lyase [Patescibacteria group bacterium]
MPELPEVQTIVDDLNKRIINRIITGVWFDAPKLIKTPKAKDLDMRIKGLRITKAERKGKNILIYLTDDRQLRRKVRVLTESSEPTTNDYLLLIHQKMTGHLLIGKWAIKKVSGNKYKVLSLKKGEMEEKVNNYIHIIFYLNNGTQLALSDLRKFAKVVFGEKEKIENLLELKKLGFDSLSVEFSEFKKIISNGKGRIKEFLMDQKKISGVGNIYADEILWKAQIHPLRPANQLRNNELNDLHKSMREVLKKAIKLRGTSVSDYRDTFGKRGTYGDERYAYRREAKLCYKCKTLIKRIKIGSRSAYFCPSCQK